MREFLYPSPLGVVQSFLKPIDDDFVNNLSLSISMRISRGRVLVCDPQFATVSSEGLAIKLESIIRNKGSRDPESCNDVSPDKSFRIYVSNVSQWLGFDSFGEVICADQQVSLVSCCFGEGAYNI